MLDLMQIVFNKLHNLNEGSLTISIDNKKVQRMTHGSLWVANYFNQDSVAEAEVIRRMLRERVDIDRVQLHRMTSIPFKQNPGPYLIKYYNQRANKVRERAHERD